MVLIHIQAKPHATTVNHIPMQPVMTVAKISMIQGNDENHKK